MQPVDAHQESQSMKGMLNKQSRTGKNKAENKAEVRNQIFNQS